MGPSATLSRMLRWENRLNCWKTIPTSERSRASSRPSSGRTLPLILITPLSIGSSRLMALHIVDLPEPEGPTTTTTSPEFTDKLMSRRACVTPNRLWTFSRTMTGVGMGGYASQAGARASMTKGCTRSEACEAWNRPCRRLKKPLIADSMELITT